jgi:hypothetical protein
MRVRRYLLVVCAAASYGAVLVVAGRSAPTPRPAPPLTSTVRGPVEVSASQMPPDRVTPERFGARGDGVADDTSALQRAIDDAHGRTVWLSRDKTYRVTRELRLPSNTTIEGGGPTTTLTFGWFDGDGGRSGGKFYLAASARNDAALSNITLSNFVVRGGGSGKPSGLGRFYPNRLACGVRLTNVTHFSLTHLEVEDTPGYALGEFGSQHGVIAYNFIHNAGRGGIGVWWHVTNARDISVSHNLIRHVGDDGIAVNGLPSEPSPVNHTALPTGIQIENNSITGWPTNINGRVLGNGIALYAVNGVTVKDNSVNRTYGSGVVVVSCGHTRCTPGGVVRSGITGQPWRSSKVKILGNTIRNAGRLYPGSTLGQQGMPTVGIFIGSAAGATVADNVIKRPLRSRIVSRHCRECSISRH